MKLLGQLTDDGFHPAAGSYQLLDSPRRTGIGHVRPQGGLQIAPHRSQFGVEKGADVALVADDQALNALGQFPKGLPFITRGRGDRPTGDDALDRDHQVPMKSIIGLFFGRAVAVIRLPGKQPTARGAGEDTQRHGATIHETNRVCHGLQIDQQVLMKSLLDTPEIGRLLDKGGSRSELWKPR
jgi:hypothetical protein